VVTVVAAGDGPAPGPDWLAAEPRLEADHPELRAWVAAQRGAAADGSPELAERLRLAVRAHITAKGLDQADAGALDTLRSRSGDCTEHAHLLCAALRSAGIPARVVVGVVYAADYGGWVGHAWVEAHAGGWLHLDAAYPGIPRTRYLALAEVAGADGGIGRVAAALAGIAGGAVETLP
jgi:transglutaminase-like putative cysteine protease